MGSFARFLCFNGVPRRPTDSGPQFSEYSSAGSQNQVLQLVEEELDSRLGGVNVSLQNVGSFPLQKMYQAGLPPQLLQLCKELLCKIAALDKARKLADEKSARLSQTLKNIEQTHRQAEFSKAKAEALATARGEALMHAQHSTREAQKEQARLAEMLKQAFQQLGIAYTPTRSPAGTPDGSMLTYGQPFSPLPITNANTTVTNDGFAKDLMKDQASHPTKNNILAESTGSQFSREFSGFTVYTNKLHHSTDIDVSAAQMQNASEEQGRKSQVSWRDISSAAEVSISADHDSLAASRSEAEAHRSISNKTAADNQQQKQFQQMARLVLPTLDASQLDSLVRIGASLPSPDMLMSPEVLSQVLPKLWDSSANPVGFEALDVKQLAQQLQLQQPLQYTDHHNKEHDGAKEVPFSIGTTGIPRAGTWLSPLKMGQIREEGEPTPSPQSHIKAVFKHTEDIQFYLPFSAGLQMPQAAAKQEYRSRAAQAAAIASSLPSSPVQHKEQQVVRPASQGSIYDQGLSNSQNQLSSWDLAAREKEDWIYLQQSSVPNAESGTVSSSKTVSVDSAVYGSKESQPPVQAGGRKQAFLSRFQPMGTAVVQADTQSTSSSRQSAASNKEVSADENANYIVQGNSRHPPRNVTLHHQDSLHGQNRYASLSGSVVEADIKYHPQQMQAGCAGKRSLPATGADTKLALCESTNAGDSYLQRLAQQRTEQMYKRVL